MQFIHIGGTGKKFKTKKRKIMNKKDMTPLREKIKEKCSADNITAYRISRDCGIRWETANAILNTDSRVLRGTLILVATHLNISL